jgi:hypothetical protein
MSLVRKKVSTVKWPVTVHLPADGGKWDKESYTGVFKVCTRSEIEELANTGDPDLIRGVLEGWEGIEEEDGTEIPFNSKNLDEWIDNPHWLRGTTKAILEILDESLAKNL